jgi:SAM-dependent methyltransferase
LQEIELIHDDVDERKLLSGAVRDAYNGINPVRVLEAGCGKRWALDTEPVPLEITGVDIDPNAMRLRREEHGDIHREIVGDLRTVELPPSAFDVAYSSYLLEHVAGAEGVLGRLIDALAPGGLLVVRVPDGKSVYGFFVRHSPHWVHVKYKRYIERKPNAAKPGHSPYPAVYDDVVSISGLQGFAAKRGLTIERASATDHYLDVFRGLRPLAEWGSAWSDGCPGVS